MEELLKKYDDTREKDTPTKIPQSVEKKDTPTKIPQSVRKKDNTRKKVIKNDIEDDIEDFNFDDKRKQSNGVDKDGYNINGIDEDGIDRDGYNINGIEGTRKKYPKRRIIWMNNDGVYYDQYRFNSEGFNKDGYDIYGFDKKVFNKDGTNKYGYKKSSGKGLNISSLLILLSRIYTNNTAGPSALARSSKELINDRKQLVENLYKNKQIIKQLYNTLSFKELYK